MDLVWKASPIDPWILMEGSTCSDKEVYGLLCNLFLRLEFNCIYIMELFPINCAPGLHMRCGLAMSQLEPAF